MAKDPEALQRFQNSFLVHKIARECKSPWLESFEGTFHASQTMWYLTTHRDISMKHILKHFGRDD